MRFLVWGMNATASWRAIAKNLVSFALRSEWTRSQQRHSAVVAVYFERNAATVNLMQCARSTKERSGKLNEIQLDFNLAELMRKNCWISNAYDGLTLWHFLKDCENERLNKWKKTPWNAQNRLVVHDFIVHSFCTISIRARHIMVRHKYDWMIYCEKSILREIPSFISI